MTGIVEAHHQPLLRVPQNFRELSTAVDELATAVGRDPASITRASSLSLSEPWGEVRANAEVMRAAGVGYLVCGWPAEGATRVEDFVTQVLPDLAG